MSQKATNNLPVEEPLIQELTQSLMKRVVLYKDFGSIRKLLFTTDDGAEKELHYNRRNGHIFTKEERLILLPQPIKFEYEDGLHFLMIIHYLDEGTHGKELIKYQLFDKNRNLIIGESPLPDVALKNTIDNHQYDVLRKLILDISDPIAYYQAGEYSKLSFSERVNYWIDRVPEGTSALNILSDQLGKIIAATEKRPKTFWNSFARKTKLPIDQVVELIKYPFNSEAWERALNNE